VDTLINILNCYLDMIPRLKYVLILGIPAALFGWYMLSRTPLIQIPNVEDVTAISVSLSNRPDSGPNISEFVIPKSHHDKILDLFRDARPDPRPSKWQGLGTVEIESHRGTSSISLFWTGQGSGAFRTSPRSYYRGSSDNAIMRAIDDARSDSM